MWKDKASRYYLVSFFSAFFLFAFIRHGTYPIEARHDSQYYFYMISQLGSAMIVSCWMITVQIRIIDSNIRKMMLYTGGLFILYFSMQMVKYCIFVQEKTVVRYMWYGYYIPMTLIPLTSLYILRYLSVPEEETLNKRWKMLLIPAALICIGFLTNDIHQLAFGIPNWNETGDKERTLELIYFVYLAFMAVLLVLAVYSVYRMRKNVKIRKKLLLPAIPLVIGIIYIVIYSVKPSLISINKHHFLELAEVFALMMITFLEIFIQIGMIPSNVGYRKLFSLTGIPARIKDNKGEMVFATKGAETDKSETQDCHVVEIPVVGGSFSYDVDLSELNRLNRELDETTTVLEARNELLRYENEITEEKEKADATIRIYDSIAEIVRPQVMEIHDLLADADNEERFRNNLVRTAVLNAYVKRRSNMELEAQKNDGALPFKELVTAVSESLEYIKLSGTETFVSSSGDGKCQASHITDAYVAFEKIAEIILGKVQYLTVRLVMDNDISIRFMFDGKAQLPDLSSFKCDGCRIDYSTDENDVELLLCIEKGGDME